MLLCAVFYFDGFPMYSHDFDRECAGILLIYAWQLAQFIGDCGCRDPPLLNFDFEFQKNGGKEMDEIHPKRYISSENPYKIWKTINDVYWISFCDGEGKPHKFTISRELFDAFNSFELEDLSFRNESDRHYEHVVLSDSELHQRRELENRAFEEAAIVQIEFRDFCENIQNLPTVQKRRFLLHYFYGFTFQEIADMEGCTYQPVQRSIYVAKKKLRIFVD